MVTGSENYRTGRDLNTLFLLERKVDLEQRVDLTSSTSSKRVNYSYFFRLVVVCKIFESCFFLQQDARSETDPSEHIQYR
jgi:hypothetical protein